MGDVSAAARQLDEIAKRLKAAGDRDLKNELLAGIRKTTKPEIPKIRDSAREKLPKRGGLAELIATSKIGTRTRLTGNSVGVQIRGTGKHDLKELNAGRLHHPVFVKNRSGLLHRKTGRGKTGNALGGTDRKDWKWVTQKVPSGFFDEPIQKDKPELQRGIESVLSAIAKKIEG
jgi:hypothetical protein